MIQNDIRVSVIVPMYNVEDYIEETIESLVDQKLDGIEIILIDDNSSDSTFEKAMGYAEKYVNIKLFRNSVNKGVGATRNIGLKMVKGQYIFFIDGDDFLAKNALDDLYQNAIKNDSDIVLGIHEQYSNKDSKTAPIFNIFPSLTNEGIIDIYNTPELFGIIVSWGKLYKRELINDILFPENINYCEDQPFTVYAYLKAKKIQLIPQTVYFYRLREGENQSLTQQIYSKPVNSLNDALKILDIGQRYFKCLIQDIEKRNRIYKFYFNRVVLWNIEPLIRVSLYSNNNNFLLSEMFAILNNWILTLDGSLLRDTAGFQVILEKSSEFASSMDTQTLDQLLLLLKNTKIKVEESIV